MHNYYGSKKARHIRFVETKRVIKYKRSKITKLDLGRFCSAIGDAINPFASGLPHLAFRPKHDRDRALKI